MTVTNLMFLGFNLSLIWRRNGKRAWIIIRFSDLDQELPQQRLRQHTVAWQQRSGELSQKNYEKVVEEMVLAFLSLYGNPATHRLAEKGCDFFDFIGLVIVVAAVSYVVKVLRN